MGKNRKRIIIKACVLGILVGFIATGGVLDHAQATLIMSEVTASRGPNETAEQAARRNYTFNIMRGTYKSLTNVLNANDELQPFAQVDLSEVPEWKNKKSLQNNFAKIRDLRFIDQGDSFLRRLSWLYPDDGCFARADLERAQFEKWNLTAPYKIIISGNLVVDTTNSTSGTVSWWWHISQIVKVENEYYVLDPAIEPSRPLPVKEWIARMNVEVATAQVAICSPYTYNIYDDCAQDYDQQQMAMNHQSQYLDLEWERQIIMGRDPKKVLGENPPWKLGAAKILKP